MQAGMHGACHTATVSHTEYQPSHVLVEYSLYGFHAVITFGSHFTP